MMKYMLEGSDQDLALSCEWFSSHGVMIKTGIWLPTVDIVRGSCNGAGYLEGE